MSTLCSGRVARALVFTGAATITAAGFCLVYQYLRSSESVEPTSQKMHDWQYRFDCLLQFICNEEAEAAIDLIQRWPRLALLSRTSDSISAAAAASQRGQTPVLQALLEAGSNLAVQSASGHSVLCFAASAGHADCVSLLLDAAAPGSTGSSGHSPMHLAASSGHAHVIRVLTRHPRYPARLDQQSNRGQTALMLAAAGGHRGAVRELLLAGSSTHLTDVNGYNALHHAVCSGSVQTLACVLAACRPPPAALDAYWNAKAPTPLVLAVASGAGDMAACLLHAGWPLLGRSRSPMGDYAPQWCTALHVAAAGGHVSLLRALLAHLEQAKELLPVEVHSPGSTASGGECIEVVDSEGYTPAAAAAAAGERAALRELLLMHPGSIEFRGHSEETLLHVASRSDRGAAVIEDLLTYGCNVDATDADNRTSAQWANDLEVPSAIRILTKHSGLCTA